MHPETSSVTRLQKTHVNTHASRHTRGFPRYQLINIFPCSEPNAQTDASSSQTINRKTAINRNIWAVKVALRCNKCHQISPWNTSSKMYNTHPISTWWKRSSTTYWTRDRQHYPPIILRDVVVVVVTYIFHRNSQSAAPIVVVMQMCFGTFIQRFGIPFPCIWSGWKRRSKKEAELTHWLTETEPSHPVELLSSELDASYGFLDVTPAGRATDRPTDWLFSEKSSV